MIQCLCLFSQKKKIDEYLNMFEQRNNYPAHDWMLCRDLKILFITPDQHKEFTQFLYFIRNCDSRANDKHSSKKQ